MAGHRFSWSGSRIANSPPREPPKVAQGCSSSLGTGRQHLLRKATLGSDKARAEGTAGSLHGDGDRGEELGHAADGGGTASQVPMEPGPVTAADESSTILGDDVEPGIEPREEEEDEDFAEGHDFAYTDDLHHENYHPPLIRWECCEGACRSHGSRSTVTLVKNAEICDPGSCLIREAVCYSAVPIRMRLVKINKGKCGCIDVSLWLFLTYSLKRISFSTRTENCGGVKRTRGVSTMRAKDKEIKMN